MNSVAVVTRATQMRPSGESIATKHYRLGFGLYMAKMSPEACQNEYQLRGWHAANNAEAESVNPGYADKQGW